MQLSVVGNQFADEMVAHSHRTTTRGHEVEEEAYAASKLPIRDSWPAMHLGILDGKCIAPATKLMRSRRNPYSAFWNHWSTANAILGWTKQIRLQRALERHPSTPRFS